LFSLFVNSLTPHPRIEPQKRSCFNAVLLASLFSSAFSLPFLFFFLSLGNGPFTGSLAGAKITQPLRLFNPFFSV